MQCIVIGPVCNGQAVFVVGGVCYHDKSILRASIFTSWSVGEGSDHLQLVKFWPSCTPGKGVCGGAKNLALRYYGLRAVFASLKRFFIVFFYSRYWDFG